MSKQKDMILINRPWIDEEERREVLDVLHENTFTSASMDGGKRVRDFESLLRNYLHVKHVIAVNSGTAALHSALLASGIKQDDEVLLPSFTFVATANSVIAAGAKPVFVDINKEDYTISISDLKSKITKRSKAVIPVHLYGHPSDMEDILDIANKSALDIIEDACQSIGATYKKKQTGTLGIMGCFSTYASKVVTSGEGGAIATNDDNLATTLKMIRNHGMVEGYDTRVFGLNLRLPEMSAAIAKVQIKKLPEMLSRRRRNAELLNEFLAKLVTEKKSDILINLPQEIESEKKFNWYLYTVAFGRERNKIKDIMLNDNIGATVYYNPPVHKTPYYEKLSTESISTRTLANTEWASEHVLSLPIHPLVTEKDLDRIECSVKNALYNV